MKQNNPEAQVKGLLSMARDKSSASRESLSDVIADLFHGRTNVLTKDERVLMHRMIRRLVEDLETSVRTGLGRQLATSASIPRATVVAVARDQDPVAYAILMDSSVLADSELIEVVRHRALQHQLAVARRRGGVSSHINDVLTQTGNADLVAGLFDDAPDGNVAQPDFDPSRIDAGDLPPDLARRLCLWVSVALRQHMLEQFKIDEVALDDALEHAVEEAGSVGGWSYSVSTPNAATNAGDPDADAQMIAHLRRGDIPQFEAVLSRISGLRPQLIGRMVYERGGEALATICMAANMSKRAFAAIFLLSREAWPEQEEVGAQEVAHALSFFDQLNPVAAKRVVSRWRRNSDYLNAIRQVSSSPKISLVQRA